MYKKSAVEDLAPGLQELHLGVKYFRCTQYSRKVTIPKALHQCNCMLTIVGYERVNPGSDVINDALKLTLFDVATVGARGQIYHIETINVTKTI